MSIGKEMIEAMEQVMNYKLDDLIAAYEKLPAYVTGERFVPARTRPWIVLERTATKRRKKAKVRQTSLRFRQPNVLRPNGWGVELEDFEAYSTHKWTGTFHKTRESAQAEADRLNEEGA